MFTPPLGPRPAASRVRLALTAFGTAVLSVLLPAASQAQWSPAGVLLFGPPADPTGVAPMADGRGGVYVVNADYRDRYGTDADAYLQHLDSGGYRHPGWPASGLAVCVMRNFQAVGSFAPDGAGGILLAWRDDRDPATTGADIYAQRIGADGVLPPGWTENGVPVCRDSSYQQLSTVYYTSIGSDGVGGLRRLGRLSRGSHRADPERLRTAPTRQRQPRCALAP